MTQFILLFHAAVFVLGLFCSFAQGQESTPLDRAVLQIDRKVYSQQFIEWYFLCRHALNPEPPKFADYMQELQAKWQDYLALAEEEMVILEEAKRLNSFAPTPEKIQAAKELIYERINSSAAFATWAKTTSLNESAIVRSADFILQLEAFKQNKLLTANPAAKVRIKEQNWFKEARDKMTVRYFENANQYIPLLRLP